MNVTCLHIYKITHFEPKDGRYVLKIQLCSEIFISEQKSFGQKLPEDDATVKMSYLDSLLEISHFCRNLGAVVVYKFK